MTIVRKCRDIDPKVLQMAGRWMHENCAAGIMSLERGDRLEQLHVQAAILIDATTVASVRNAIYHAIGWRVIKSWLWTPVRGWDDDAQLTVCRTHFNTAVALPPQAR